MKYILISFGDDHYDDNTLAKVGAALSKLKPAHVQVVTFGNGDLKEYTGKHRKDEEK